MLLAVFCVVLSYCVVDVYSWCATYLASHTHPAPSGVEVTVLRVLAVLDYLQNVKLVVVVLDRGLVESSAVDLTKMLQNHEVGVWNLWKVRIDWNFPFELNLFDLLFWLRLTAFFCWLFITGLLWWTTLDLLFLLILWLFFIFGLTLVVRGNLSGTRPAVCVFHVIRIFFFLIRLRLFLRRFSNSHSWGSASLACFGGRFGRWIYFDFLLPFRLAFNLAALPLPIKDLLLGEFLLIYLIWKGFPPSLCSRLHNKID